MGTNLVGRGRSVGIGQQELEPRLPKRSGSSTEASVVFQRGLPNLTHVLREAMSTPPKILAAQQGMVDHIGPVMTPNSQAVATGAIKNPSLSTITTPKVTSHQDAGVKLVIRATQPHEATRKLLSDPTQQTYIANCREQLALTGQVENIDFLLDLKKFKDNPSLEAAKELKRIYIDLSEESSYVPQVKADQFGMQCQEKTLNITAKDLKFFLTDFNSCIKQIERGESFSKSGMAEIFEIIEKHASALLIKELRELKKG